MTAELFLIAPADADSDGFPALLEEVLDAASVAALLLPKGARDEAGYDRFVRVVLPVAQAKDCAVLLEDAPELAKKTGADGVHVTAGLSAVKAAIKALKPDLIVGVGAIGSRHFAMTAGEAGADYIFFSGHEGDDTTLSRDNAAWWAETFEIPAVWHDPAPDLTALDDAGCEFVALGATVWAAPEGPVKAITEAARQLDQAAS